MVESLIRVIFVVELDRASRGDIASEARNWRRFNPAPLFREFSLDNILTSRTRSSMHQRHHWSRGDSVVILYACPEYSQLYGSCLRVDSALNSAAPLKVVEKAWVE